MIDEWRRRAPALARECAELWALRLGEPYEHGHVSLTLRAELPDGTPAALKVGFPHPEAEHEAEALRHYDGQGAVRLLEHDPPRSALLLERCEPGTPLWQVDDEAATLIAGSVLRRLWSVPLAPGHGFRSLADEAATWAEGLREDWERLGRPFERARPRTSSSSATRTSRGATSCARGASPGWRSTRSRSPASRPSTSPRSCATGVGTSAPMSSGTGWISSLPSSGSTASGCAAGASSTRSTGAWGPRRSRRTCSSARASS